jgi:hypothetical protein
MEAMRSRLFAAVASLGLLSALVGCHHTAGCCDCENEGYGCCYGSCGHYGGGPGDGHVISSVAIGAPVTAQAAPPIAKPADTADKPVDKIPATASKPDDAPSKDKE